MPNVPTPDPSPDELAEYLEAVRDGWSAAEEAARRCVPPVSAYFHLAAEILGADRRVAQRIFRGSSEPYTVPCCHSTLRAPQARDEDAG